MAASKVSFKIFIDSRKQKVVFAEAGTDFIDFLFNILSLPMCSVIHLITNDCMVGCLANLCKSIEILDRVYWKPDQSKDYLLRPETRSFTGSVLKNPSPPISGGGRDNPLNICPNCRNPMHYVLPFGGGYVKEVVTYMVMDDLSVMPMSAMSIITLFNKFSVKQVGDLEEKVIDLDWDKGVKLLRASLESKTVLTTVFLGETGA